MAEDAQAAAAGESRAARLVRDANAEVGDELVVKTGDGREVRGRLMERHAFSDPEVLTLKMSSGYNVGIAVDDATELTIVGRPARTRIPREMPETTGKPKVSVLATGGTIASYVDYRTGAVHPATSPEELALAAPELFDVADLSTKIVFSMFSEDMQPEHWQALAREVKAEFDAGARGVVVTHGTDTLGYTAAALAFFLKDLPGPVVLVGAQRSSDRPSSDASLNLLAAVTVAAETDIGEVVAVMHGESGDRYALVHRGVRVRKMHTSRRDAFQSVNAHPLGRVDFDLSKNRALVKLTRPYRAAGEGPVQVDDAIDEEVSIIQSYPGLWPDHLEKVVLKGVVLVGTGLGHIAQRNLDMIRAITTGTMPDGTARKRYDGEAAGPGVVVMTSQTIHGRVNMNVYSSGRDLVKAGVISAEDMSPETAYVKLMWVLGHTRDPEEVRRLMQTDLVGEMSGTTPVDVFPTAPGAE